MPPRDDKARFEQVLARHLRHGASCADAETLAAYHERALTAEEMNAFKGHIAACGRCQEILAGLEASEGVIAREEDDLRVASLGVAAESMRAAAAMPAAQATPARPKRVWKWMAPAAAVAAGILVWVAVRETPRAPAETTTVAVNKQPSDAGRASAELSAQAPAQSADGRVSTAGKPAQSVPPAALPSTGLSETRKETDELMAQSNAGKDRGLYQKVPRQDANAKTRQHANSERADNQVSTPMKQQAAADLNAAQENLKAPAPQSAQAGMESGKKVGGQQVAMDNAPANSSEYRAGQVTAEKAKRAAQEEQQRQAQVDKDTVAAAAAGAAETKIVGTANERKNEKLQRLAKPAAEPQVTSTLRHREAFFAKDATGLVVTPEKDVMWRVGATGMILKTVDGGLSWAQQASEVSMELLAGSAPSEKVCWIVGRSGVILRTRDGEHWERVPSPTKADLIAIEARDAQTAVVWTSEKLPKYVTRDGGKTWQRAGADEQP